LHEFERVKQLLSSGNYPKANVGLRINPQVGLGTIKEMSTSGNVSKFGIAYNDFSDKIYQAYAEYSWLNGIHIHVGSQGCPLSLMLNGIRKIVDIVSEINQRANYQQIKFIDIGGGLPVNFDDEYETSESAPSFSHYASLLKQSCPELFSGQYTVITEYGRRYTAKQGFIVSRVEYTKVSGGRNIATIHTGSDLFIRTVWTPSKWALRVSLLSSFGLLKSFSSSSSSKNEKGEDQSHSEIYDVAGPCCMQGDIIAHERKMPVITPGDFIIVHDTGGYYLSSYSYYNLRQAPAVYGYEETENVNLILLKAAHSVEDTSDFLIKNSMNIHVVLILIEV